MRDGDSISEPKLGLVENKRLHPPQESVKITWLKKLPGWSRVVFPFLPEGDRFPPSSFLLPAGPVQRPKRRRDYSTTSLIRSPIIKWTVE
jgi:hypothetical protein